MAGLPRPDTYDQNEPFSPEAVESRSLLGFLPSLSPPVRSPRSSPFYKGFVHCFPPHVIEDCAAAKMAIQESRPIFFFPERCDRRPRLVSLPIRLFAPAMSGTGSSSKNISWSRSPSLSSPTATLLWTPVPGLATLASHPLRPAISCSNPEVFHASLMFVRSIVTMIPLRDFAFSQNRPVSSNFLILV